MISPTLTYPSYHEVWRDLTAKSMPIRVVSREKFAELADDSHLVVQLAREVR
jgi:hypothetical protein